MLETRARMIEDIEAFEKAELTTKPLVPLKKLIFRYVIQILLGLIFAGMLFILQRMFCLVVEVSLPRISFFRHSLPPKMITHVMSVSRQAGNQENDITPKD